MKTQGKVERIKWDYFEKVEIPEDLKKYLWDYEDEVYLEVLILRVLTYGNFEEIRKYMNFIQKKLTKLPLNILKLKEGSNFG